MLKAFLSHSSRDKAHYVSIVAKHLGLNRVVYDELTFEEGMKSYDEIHRGLSQTAVFVLFLSDAALNSDWVRLELNHAYQLLQDGDLRQFYPIIIDPKITYNDSRIPEWLKREYNLKLVSRPSLAARRIVEHLRLLSWDLHPRLRERERLFVGRNSLLSEFEERIDSFDQQIPISVIASGLKGIGRRTLLKHCLVKANILPEAREAATLVLDETESIEDFILKLFDIGFSTETDLADLLSRPLEEKVSTAVSLLRDAQAAREVIFVLDDGAIVTPDSVLSDWFQEVMRQLSSSEQLTLAIASSYRITRKHLHDLTAVFRLEVPELEPRERNGLLKRYAELRGLQLSVEELRFFSGALTGLPEQVFFAVDLIVESGVIHARKSVPSIVEFNSQRVVNLILRYENEPVSIEFLGLLAQFDFISYTFIFEIVGGDPIYPKLLDQFLTSAICEYVGAAKEYLRLNDAVRDYVGRNYVLSARFNKRLQDHLQVFLKDYSPGERDISDVLYNLKAALLSNLPIDQRFLIPSHFLKSIKELYDRQNRHEEVIHLARRVLDNAEYMDSAIEHQVRYYLCLSLARRRDAQFLDEVQAIRKPEHNFLFGFYYRHIGNYARSIDQLQIALNQRPNFPRARNELARVYLYIDEFEKALHIAKASYEHDRTNPYFIKSYFDSLIRSERTPENGATLRRLLEDFTRLKVDRVKEMFLNAQALYTSIYADDEIGALNLLKQAEEASPTGSLNTLITKFYICEQFGRVDEIRKILRDLERMGLKEKSHFGSRYSMIKAVYLAMQGDVRAASDYARLQLGKTYPADSLNRLIAKLPTHAESAARSRRRP